jgi:exonuclease VII small subunit
LFFKAFWYNFAEKYKGMATKLEKERKAYDAYLRHMMSIASRNHTIEIDAKEIIEKTKKETREITIEEIQIESVIGFYENGVQLSIIAKSLKITEDRVKQIIDKHKNKA